MKEKNLHPTIFANKARPKEIFRNFALAAAVSFSPPGVVEPVKDVQNFQDDEKRVKMPYTLPVDFSDQDSINIFIPQEQQEKNPKNERDLVIETMQSIPKVFSTKKIEDVEMYYPIYKVAADKYKIDWYLLWIVHEAETGASRGERGFAPDSYYKGAMQRDPNFWPQEYVDNASKDLEYLSDLPQRRKEDWKEILAAANILRDNIVKYMAAGDTKEQAVLKALLLYSADGPAKSRFEDYKVCNDLFSKETFNFAKNPILKMDQ